MTEIEKKALALVNEVERDFGDNSPTIRIIREDLMAEALCRAIEQHEADKAAHAATVEGILNSHEAFRQKVSEALRGYFYGTYPSVFEGFILPKPADPLVEALGELADRNMHVEQAAETLRNALAKCGLKIVEDV